MTFLDIVFIPIQFAFNLLDSVKIEGASILVILAALSVMMMIIMALVPTATNGMGLIFSSLHRSDSVSGVISSGRRDRKS